MTIVRAMPADVEPARACLVEAFATDPVTGYFFASSLNRRKELLSQFFSLLLQARLRMDMPVFVARRESLVCGVAMGYTTERPEWPADLAEAWDRMERSVPGMNERASLYEAVSGRGKPGVAHYYLGVIGVDPSLQGKGIGARLLRAFCASSLEDVGSRGVYLETATPDNVPFYEREGFAVTHAGEIGGETLWCMYLEHVRAGA